MVWTARNTPSTTCFDPGSASRERRRWLIDETCSRDSERKSSPYCESSMEESAKVRRCEGAKEVEEGAGSVHSRTLVPSHFRTRRQPRTRCTASSTRL